MVSAPTDLLFKWSIMGSLLFVCVISGQDSTYTCAQLEASYEALDKVPAHSDG